MGPAAHIKIDSIVLIYTYMTTEESVARPYDGAFVLLVVVREHPLRNREGAWATCKKVWRYWSGGPGKWYHLAYIAAANSRAIPTPSKYIYWGSIPLVHSPDEDGLYTAISNIDEGGTTRHYIYAFTCIESTRRSYWPIITGALKCNVKEGVCLEILPFANYFKCDCIDDLFMFDAMYMAFYVNIRGQHLVLATERCTKPTEYRVPPLDVKTTLISCTTAGLLRGYMRSYRFDILEYLREIGIVVQD